MISLVGSWVRFPGSRAVRFTRPAELTGQPRLIGTWRRDAVVWAPTGATQVTVYRIRPGGAVVRIGKPVLDLSGGGVEWQVANDVLWVLTTDARSRTLMAKLDLPSGKVSREWTSAEGHHWSLLEVLVHCTLEGTCERASRVAPRITLQTYGSGHGGTTSMPDRASYLVSDQPSHLSSTASREFLCPCPRLASPSSPPLR